MPKPLPTAPPGPPGSLAAALAAVPDPRHPNGWRPDRAPLPLVGLLRLAVAALHRVFTALDVTACERALGDWLVASGVDPADALALDGKTLRGIQGDTV